MFKLGKTYISESRVKSASTEAFAGKRFVAASLMAVSFAVLSLQAGFVLNANATGNPISSPISYSSTPTPTPSSSSAPITYPVVSPSPSASPSTAPITSPIVTPSPSASPSSAPITAPEVTPSPSASASATPSVIPSATPTPTPSASVSPSATPSTSPYLKLHFPNGGETFNVRDFVRIGWEQEGLDNYNCLFRYVNDSEVYGTHIFQVNPLQLYFNWIVDVSGLTPGNSAKIKADIICSDPAHNGVFDRSDDFFNVYYPHFTPAPTATPTPTPSAEPSNAPSPSSEVSSSPSPEVSASPSAQPSATPAPSNAPSSNNNSTNNNGGSVSAPSCDNEAPKATKLISALKGGDNEVVLNWEKASGNVTHYAITYGFSAGKPLFGNPNVGNVTTYTVKGLSGDATYYFRVKAVNGCMPGAYSNEIAVKASGKTINQPAIDFKPGVLGKSNESTKSANLDLTPNIPSFENLKPEDIGLLGKIWNFLKGLFS